MLLKSVFLAVLDNVRRAMVLEDQNTIDRSCFL
jgi:hypothetical protein